MTLATASVIKSVDPASEPNFTVAYLPMNTGPYSWNSNFAVSFVLILMMIFGKAYARNLKLTITQEQPEVE
jgi:hypothetical protein